VWVTQEADDLGHCRLEYAAVLRMGYPVHGESVSVGEECCQDAVSVAELSEGSCPSLWWTDPCLKQISWLPRLYRELFASQ
jgi:hypothetical protein